MKIGLQCALMLPDLEASTISNRYQEFVREIQWANDEDFAGIWLTEHHFSNYSATSSTSVLLATVAALAPRVRIGSSIFVLPLWDPVRLAADVTMLDLVSNGRFDFGIGRGYQPHEFRGFGKDPAQSREMFEEAVELVCQLLTEKDKEFHGKFYDVNAPVTLIPPVTQRPHPPIWMATSSPDSVRFAARKGFHFMTPTIWNAAEIAVQRDFIESCVAESGGTMENREFEANRLIFCGYDEAEFEAVLTEAIWFTQISQLLLRGAVPKEGMNLEVPAADDSIIAGLKERMIVGSPEHCIAKLKELGEAGITYVLAQFQFARIPGEMAKRSRELFAKEVLPHVKNF